MFFRRAWQFLVLIALAITTVGTFVAIWCEDSTTTAGKVALSVTTILALALICFFIELYFEITKYRP